VAVITWDMPGRSLNVFTMAVMDELERIVETVAADEAIKGAVIVSGKKDFSGGADITMLHGLFGPFQDRLKDDPHAARQEPFRPIQPHVPHLPAAGNLRQAVRRGD
jgi:3-hydroxyacyl-CoA dehydrogenase/enoyl-CoA hydratase/3-hydroxybutyryl-CoA epimerase